MGRAIVIRVLAKQERVFPAIRWNTIERDRLLGFKELGFERPDVF